MKTIEVTTAQNVVIQFQPATVFDRILAFIIDLILMGIGVGLMNAICLGLFPYQEWMEYAIILLFAFYSFLFERFMDGRTPGKAVMNLKVVKTDGSQPEGIDFFKRWATRLIDIVFTMGSLAVLTIASSERSQRLGDKVADTMVIKVPKGSRYRLNEIIKLGRGDTYTPIYPEVAQMPEEHMITLKRLVTRYKKSGNSDVYRKLIHEATEKMEMELGVKRLEPSKAGFLRQLIRDYVILTR
ncbi:MAG: RDD family protein [Flavobacteriales bacterium]|nr:RDD family protein [Bacteroidota bacterium]MCB9241430.1 RDD family protein [Flavobacteriales bacterium]